MALWWWCLTKFFALILCKNFLHRQQFDSRQWVKLTFTPVFTEMWLLKLKQSFTCAETSLKLVSPFPEGWSIAEELTTRSSRPKLSLTLSAAPRMSSSWFTSSLRTVSRPGCWPARLRNSAAPSGFRHVATTVASDLFLSICLQNSKPSPLLAPWIRAMGAAMVDKWHNEQCLLPSLSRKGSQHRKLGAI